MLGLCSCFQGWALKFRNSFSKAERKKKGRKERISEEIEETNGVKKEMKKMKGRISNIYKNQHIGINILKCKIKCHLDKNELFMFMIQNTKK